MKPELTFIKRTSKLKALYLCGCGNEKEINMSNVNSGKQVSCGCYGIYTKRQSQIKKALARKTIKHKGYIELELTGGEYTLLDYEDYEKIKEYSWYQSIRKSVESRIGGKLIKIHRLIMDAPKGKVVDHINGNELDNRKNNLRVCTSKQNSLNRLVGNNNVLGVKGVRFDKKKNKYASQISLEGKRYWGGYFNTLEEAKNRVNILINNLHGEYGRLN